jgi:lipase chaperone LimK
MGRQMTRVGIDEEMAVELQAITQVLRPHDRREVAALRWQERALLCLGELVEANGTPTQQKIYRALLVNAGELQRANRVEDIEHAGLFTVAEAVAS